MNSKHIQLLDCTLRDGGMELANAKDKGWITCGFSDSVLRKITSGLMLANIDIIETASISENGYEKKEFAVFGDPITSSRYFDRTRFSGMMAVLYMGPNVEYSRIPYADQTLCDAARVMLRYSELGASLDLCEELAYKGYKVFIQPSITMRYSLEELLQITKTANKINAYAMYIVDSYGYMLSDNIRKLVSLYDSELDENIKIGLHTHNNINMALSNAIEFLNMKTDRDLILDACLSGLGQGAGNLQTELITHYLNRILNAGYDIFPVLDSCQIVDKFKNVYYEWGYSVPRMIAAANLTSYKYGDTLRYKYGLSYSQIYRALMNMPEEIRQRYTDYNAEKVYLNFVKVIEEVNENI